MTHDWLPCLLNTIMTLIAVYILIQEHIRHKQRIGKAKEILTGLLNNDLYLYVQDAIRGSLEALEGE